MDGQWYGRNLPKSRVDITSAVLRNSTRKGKPSGHLTETLHHSEDGTTGDSVTQQDRERTSLRKGASNTKEKTGSDCATESDELDVSRLQASLDIAELFSGADLQLGISIDVSA